jgi:hypothetical protein
MLTQLEETIYRGLKTKSPVFLNGILYHITHRGENLDFFRYPYLKQIYMDETQDSGIMKSTQSGVSEYLLCRTFAYMEQGRNVFYVLPTDKLIGRFVRERFDKSIMNSPHYKSLMKDTENATSNVTMKQMGKGTVAFVGSNSAVSFTEFPADDGIIDENDRCDQANILMVDDRTANSVHRTKFAVGQPSITDFGIHKKFKESRQWYWYIKCPRCNKWFRPQFLEHAVVQEREGVWTYLDTEWEPNLERDPYMLHECGQVIDRKQDGHWIATYPTRRTSYYHIGKEFSTQVTMRELCAAFSHGLDDDAAMQRFYNSDLGLPYTPKGSQITDADLNAIVSDYVMPSMVDTPCVMGVDVGARLHVRINQILPDGSERAVYIGWVKEKEDILNLLSHYRIVCMVVDALPEIRLSRELSSLKQCFRCYFHSNKSQDIANPVTKEVTVNRTELIDSVISKIREKRMVYPRNAASIPELYDHMKALTRVYNEDKLEYEYIGENPDHLLFAEAYATLARRIIGTVPS